MITTYELSGFFHISQAEEYLVLTVSHGGFIHFDTFMQVHIICLRRVISYRAIADLETGE